MITGLGKVALLITLLVQLPQTLTTHQLTIPERLTNSASFSYLSSFDVSHIDSLVLIQWEGCALGEDLYLNGRDILNGSPDHPSVTRLTLLFLNGEKRGIYNIH